MFRLPFRAGSQPWPGWIFFRFFTQTVRKYNQKRVTVQYAIQTNGLAITEEWAEFFSKDHFLVGISLDGTPDVHDALRPDAQGNGTWDKITQTIKLLRRCGVECNLLCVVTKRLAKKAERVYKSMKATGVRYLQFIPCLDPLDTPQGQQNYSLTPELYAQFLCAMFDAWYRDWKTSTYISIRLFEDYIHLLMGSPAGTCSTTGTCGAYMVVEGSGAVYPCDFFCLDAYKLGTGAKRHPAIAAYRQENADIYHRRLADPRRVPAVQMDPPVPRRLQARPQCYRHCAAQLLLQSPAKVFCLCGTAPVRDGPRRSNVPLKRRQILLDKKNKYWQLFLSTFKLSACTFGGGFVIIPLMRERFVKELRWIEEEEMLDLTAIAQSSPGSIAINASILVGYHVAGIPGVLITVVGAALPPLIIISIISAFYQAFRSNKYVSMAMAGMLAGVAAVVFDVVINMAWPILKKKRWLPIAVMLAAFLATRFFSVNIILIILVCGVIGALDTLYLQKREDDK